MAHLSASIDIPVSPDEIWQLIGGFGSLPNWLSFMPTSELTEGGRVRRLANRDGETLVERLVAFDDTARSYSYSYSFLDAPLGMSVRDLAARLRLPAHGAPPPINSSASSSHQVSTASLASSASPEPR